MSISNRDVEHLLEPMNERAQVWCRQWLNSTSALPGVLVYVKTIYIGVEFNGAMFAALYPGATKFELALAIPEETPGSDLIDASHLTWPSLPLALASSYGQLERAVTLTALAYGRVSSGEHDLRRPAESFRARKAMREGRTPDRDA